MRRWVYHLKTSRRTPSERTRRHNPTGARLDAKQAAAWSDLQTRKTRRNAAGKFIDGMGVGCGGAQPPSVASHGLPSLNLRPLGYEADQKKNIGPLDFNYLCAKPLISLDYLAAFDRNQRKGP
jgi:hypothetical protein